MVSKNVGITQMAKSHLLLGHDSVFESPSCTWYSSPAQLRWFMRMTIASSSRQFSTYYWLGAPQKTSQTGPLGPVLRARMAKGLGPNLRWGAHGGFIDLEGQRKFFQHMWRCWPEGTEEDFEFGLKFYIFALDLNLVFKVCIRTTHYF